jgi:signal transduction histidine kinase/Tfp pilus assembly protein PilF
MKLTLLRYQFVFIRVITTFILLSAVTVLFAQDQAKVDSLNLVLKTTSGLKQFDVYQEFFKAYNSTDFEKALSYADKALKIAQTFGDSAKIVEGMRMKAYSLLDLGRINEAITNLVKGIDIAERNKERYPELKPKIKFLLNNAGIAYMYRGNYDSSLSFHFKSLEIREQEGDLRSKGTALNNIGLVFFKLKNFDQAVQFYLRSIEVKKELEDNTDLDKILTNIGLCYSQLNKPNEAISSFNDALRLCGDNCTDEQKRDSYYGLGLAYFTLSQLSKAEENFLLSLEISRNQNDKLHWIDNLMALSRIETQRKNYEKSLRYLNEAKQFEGQVENAELWINLYDEFSKVYVLLSDYKNASEFQEKYISLKDSVYSGQLIKNLTKIQTSYEQRENLKTISEKNRVLQLQNELISRQKTQYLFIVIVTILATGLALVLISANRKQKKDAVALNEAKRVISDQNEKLRQSNEFLDHEVANRTKELILANDALRHVNSELDNFIYRTSHDIRGPLVTLKGICNVALLDVNDPIARNYLEKFDSTSERLNIILTRLLLVNRISHWELEPAVIHVSELVDLILKEEVNKGVPDNFIVDHDISPELKIESDRFLISLVIENLIDNAIKFYNTSDRVTPFVKVSAFVNGENKLVVKVIDNGIGINLDDKDQIFKLFNRASERSETGGIGLYISRLASEKLGGGVILASTSPNGSEFHLIIPIYNQELS